MGDCAYKASLIRITDLTSSAVKMATSIEYNSLDEAVDVANRLSQKIDGASKMTLLRHAPIMIAMVSNKAVTHVGDEVATSPSVYNHPLFLCDASQLGDISCLPQLVYPDSARLFLFSSPQHPDLFVDPVTGEEHCTSLHLDLEEIK